MTLSIRTTLTTVAAAFTLTSVSLVSQTKAPQTNVAASAKADVATKRIADVSEFQGDINWKEASKHLDAVITRVQAGNPGDDGYHYDTKAKTNAQGAKSNHLSFGQYEYSQFTSVKDAQNEAKSFYQHSDKSAKFLVLDNETRATSDGSESDYVKAWVKQMKKLTNKPLVYYSSENFAKENNIDTSQFSGSWIANYSSKPEKTDLWQYSQSGSVKGIDGDVDMDTAVNNKTVASWLD
ncbi:GH25 family lysozyme [Levilactobacillus bambusae]|nr:GH25 family lysozyme [Levilactobacillus bambusae]